MKNDELKYDEGLADDALVMNCSTRHNNNYHAGDTYTNGDCIGATDDLCPYDLLDNIQNDTHTLTHMLLSLISIAQDMRDRYVHNTKHGGHDDAQQYKELDPIAVSVPEATRMLGFKDMRVVDRLIRNGDIKARKIGRVWRVNLKSLYEYMGA